MSKSIISANGHTTDNATKVKEGDPFHIGNVSFCVMTLDKDKPGIWYVRQSSLGAGFVRTRPQITRMSEERILELISQERGNRDAMRMNTVGNGANGQSRGRNTRERHPLRFSSFSLRRIATF